MNARCAHDYMATGFKDSNKEKGAFNESHVTANVAVRVYSP